MPTFAPFAYQSMLGDEKMDEIRDRPMLVAFAPRAGTDETMAMAMALMRPIEEINQNDFNVTLIVVEGDQETPMALIAEGFNSPIGYLPNKAALAKWGLAKPAGGFHSGVFIVEDNAITHHRVPATAEDCAEAIATLRAAAPPRQRGMSKAEKLAVVKQFGQWMDEFGDAPELAEMRETLVKLREIIERKVWQPAPEDEQFFVAARELLQKVEDAKGGA